MTTEVKKDSEFKKLLEDKQYFNLPKIGDLVKGTVISATKNEVHVDLGGIAKLYILDAGMQALKQRGVAFTEKDVDDETNAEDAQRLSGQDGVPVVQIGTQVIVGFDPGRFALALR